MPICPNYRPAGTSKAEFAYGFDVDSGKIHEFLDVGSDALCVGPIFSEQSDIRGKISKKCNGCVQNCPYFESL